MLTDAQVAADDGASKASSTGNGMTMEEEVNNAFEALSNFDPTQLGMNVSRGADGAFLVTLPPRTPPGSTRGGSEFSMLRSNNASAAAEGSHRSGTSSLDNSRHGPTELADLRIEPPKPAMLAHASGTSVAAPAAPAPAALPASTLVSKLSPEALAAAQKAAAEVPVRGRRSFVARLRDPETGAMSNPRLFGGSVGASTAMTRSIGDRGAARCCIAEPEFTTQLVEPGQKARVIVASDGMWDVYADDESETISRGTRMDGLRSSADAASLLAKRAQEDRSFDGLSPDDITIIVIDIHGGALPAAGDGGCCALM